MPRRFLLPALAGLALPLAAGEGDWFARAWHSGDGLPNNDVTGIAQEASGPLLFATRGGLARFDGWRFREVALHLPGKPGRSVTAVLPARDGSLWMVTRGVLVRQRPGFPDEVVDMPLLDVPASRETAFFEDAEGTVWLCYERGRLHRLRDGHIEQAPTAPGLSATFASCATLDDKGAVWAAGPHVLARWSKGRFDPIATLPKDRCVLCKASAGGVWIGTGQSVLRSSPQGELRAVAQLTSVPPGTKITSMLEDGRGRLWLGTFGGGLWLRDEDSRLQTIPLPNSDIWWLSEDHEGNLWVATGGGGICRVRPRILAMLREPDGPNGETVRSLCLDQRGDLWATVQNGSHLCVRRGGRWQRLTPAQDWPGTKAIRVKAGPGGYVWIGTGEGDLVRWDGSAFEKISLPPDKSNLFIFALLETRSGEIWVSRGFRVWRGHQGLWNPVPQPSNTGEVLALAEDPAGQVWAGTSRGSLLRSTDGKFVREGEEALGLTCYSIRALLPLPDGALLAGTEGAGIVRVAKGCCGLVTHRQGLPHDTVSQLALDGQGRLWAGSDAGIFMAPLDQINAVAEGRSTFVQTSDFGTCEGVCGLQANASFPGSLRTPEGQLWFSTRNGIVIANPELVGNNRVPPPVSIGEVRVNGARLPDPSLMGPGVTRVQFEVSAASFTAPERVRLEHRLTGMDTGWVVTPPEREASYTNLPPGNYTLRVRAANNDGVWSTKEATLAFSVRPHWWQTLWFDASMALAGLAAAARVTYLVFARRARRQSELLKREAALCAERARISRDMHDQVGASLTQIKLLAELAESDGVASAHLPQLAETARQAVEELDAIVWAVNPKHDHLASLLDYLSKQAMDLTLPAGIRCRLHLPEQIPSLHLSAEQRRHVFLIVREALNNAIKHSGASEVNLRVAVQGNLQITIEDNGRGFDKISLLSNGLANMQARAAQIGGSCSIRNLPGGGTEVGLSVPKRSPSHPPP